ncbi:MAG: glucosaminidase domain-containing protein [Bacteroidales bacterium]|nr:glucosaminidase domain-containing protein [Bacteroidales bacterium]
MANHKISTHRLLPGMISRILLITIIIFSNDGLLLLSNHSNVMGSINNEGQSYISQVKNKLKISPIKPELLTTDKSISFNHPAFIQGSSTVIGNIPNFIGYTRIDDTLSSEVHIKLPEQKSTYRTQATLIMGYGAYKADELAKFLIHNNKSVDYGKALEIANTYIQQAKLEGVNHDIAFVQMCHETGFLRYNGVMKPEQNNFCGLGTVNDYTPGEVFVSAEQGITAHIQHLKAYACKEALKGNLVDQRFRFVQRGTAPHLDDLTGRWASDQMYAEKIQKLIIRLNSQFNS